MMVHAFPAPRRARVSNSSAHLPGRPTRFESFERGAFPLQNCIQSLNKGCAKSTEVIRSSRWRSAHPAHHCLTWPGRNVFEKRVLGQCDGN